ncbi:M23 family metallopeptidase [Anaerotignum sp.]|uniref:M23 family metallopeptidase n=1 Tax=Anaerotignum sp. TaxID=2039241 RepID=UPI00289E577E|nr:M23 family metallopeptidase [Anaerotignum sp.]
MKNKNKRTAMWTATICGCLCLLAVGAGVVWQAMDYQEAVPPTPQFQEKANETPADQQTPAPKATTPSAPVFGYPVQGEVVMPYSVDCAIYDPTLNQYHTNASVSISAAAGDPVQAAEKGTVKEITKDEEKGTSLVIEHENGWLTTYSQLAEDISVKVGDAVEKGQAIGTVGEPTKYTIALGSHVEFAVEKDGAPVDPAKAVQDE